MPDLSFEGSLEASLEKIAQSPELARLQLIEAFKRARASARTISSLAAYIQAARDRLEKGDTETVKTLLDRAMEEFRKSGGFTTEKLPGRD